ncbi:helix-turn-helix transcriptional regulator [Streptomyces sp. PH10-H1]|uniref:helix-turn-helix domain-containing protein n=1 Tax=Streptomyces sp. PH10-H1 TaxID=3046212 RepID=UPI0024B9E38D|nr:helix-turn-helix transcriptional regulator [Streptomyces sp. PH10-H1]MDJ0341770.1 helix-turn-helix transcriptional regulator [Streptomyces sp. PH10-H1]
MTANANDRNLPEEVSAQIDRANDDRQLPPMSADGVASYNLLRARELRGWTQQEAAVRISETLGKPWSIAVYAAAERSHRSARVKEFSTDELVAMSRAFRLPLTWWFLPPGPFSTITPRNAGDDVAISGDELLGLLFPIDGEMVTDLQGRTQALFTQFAAQGPARDSTGSYLAYVARQNATLHVMAASAFKAANVEDAPRELEDIARRLKIALGVLTSDLQHDGLQVTENDSSAGEDAGAAVE